jgi:hypothetical protein
MQTRKRGVETKLIIGHVALETDNTLICNLALSDFRRLFGCVRSLELTSLG